ncbi:MAG: hypothetical protein HKM00_02065 [Gallionella sp.]|nr:hypothetical protein [Gallionella sp.]
MSFFDLNGESALPRAGQLVAKDRDGEMQTMKVSEHSPGPVANDELLARSLDYPNKFIAPGGLNDTLFQDAFSHGASVQRLLQGWDAHADDVHSRFEARAQARREGTDGRHPNPPGVRIFVVCFEIS